MTGSQRPILLDTCTAIWLVHGDALNSPGREALESAFNAGGPVAVSPITAWEIGNLVAKGRLRISMQALRWFEALLELPGMSLADMPPEVLIASAFLPGQPPADPADRILAATAREYGYRLVTRDRLLLAYAEAGHLAALAC